MSVASYHLTLALGWIAYVLLHSLLAADWFKQRMAKFMGRGYRYYRLLYSIFAAITLALLLYYQFSEPSQAVFAKGIFTDVAGVLIGIMGFAGMAICIRKYFFNLSGVDVLMKVEHQSVLEVKGLHRAVRHPLYSSTLLFCWGLFLLLPFWDNFLSCAIITFYTLLGIRLEEKKLVEEFGRQYQSYAATTPMIIPDISALLRNSN